MTGRSNHTRADLHVHTVASDGCWSPHQLVEEVQRAGIACFAVSDHDSVDSVAQTELLARSAGLAFLRGVEISSKLDGRMVHILGYGFDLRNELFRQFVRANETMMDRYDDFLVQSLIDAGHEIDSAEYAEYSWDRRRGGWRSLNFLIDKGFCRDVQSFFGKLFTGDLRVTFPDFPSPAEVVEVITQAGGVSVWAHPANSLSKVEGYAPEDDETVVERMVEAGIQGLECHACHHDPQWTERCLGWAARHGLLVTGGSDSHGGFAGRQLGQPVLHLEDLRLGPIADRIVT